MEKSPSKMMVSKLRDILLLGANFNALHNVVFNHRILLALEQNNLIPMEIVDGWKIQAEIHVAINKKLMSDVSNQVKTPSVVISTDATNCYNRVFHSFARLTAHHFGVNTCYIMGLFQVIKSMIMLMRTSFGTSST